MKEQLAIYPNRFTLLGAFLIPLLCVTNPAALIDEEPNAKYRKLMLHNLNHYGTPFILAPTLNFSTGELLSTLREYHQKYSPHGSA